MSSRDHDQPTNPDGVTGVTLIAALLGSAVPAADGALLFRDLEPNLGEIQQALDDGRYDDDPYIAEHVRRRLSILQNEQRFPSPTGQVDLAVVGSLISDLLRTVTPFHATDVGGDVADATATALEPEMSDEDVPRRILEATSRYGAPAGQTATRLGWWPGIDRAAAIVTVGTGVGVITHQLLGLQGVPAAIVSLGLMIAAYMWHRRSPD